MAAAFSGVTPTWVVPYAPEFHTIVTQAESMRKCYANLSGSSPMYRYKLKWTEMTDGEFWQLHHHYYGCLGGYDSFIWKDVPSYIDADHDGTPDGDDMTGRWVEGSFKFSPNPRSWNAEVDFEEEVS